MICKLRGVSSDEENRNRLDTVRQPDRIFTVAGFGHHLYIRLPVRYPAGVFKHAGATRVDIELHFRGCMVSITIKDNGSGYDTPPSVTDFVRQGKLGLTEIHEKAQSIGATVTMQSQPGIGTKIDLIIPALDIPVNKPTVKASSAPSRESF